MAEQMKLSFLATTASKIDELPIVNGQFILIKDTNTIAVDMNDKRTKYEQIITLESDSDRSSILAPVNGVFYFVVETNSLWKYDQGWKMICSAQSLVPAGGSSGQVLTKQSDTNGDVSWQNPSVSDEQVTTAVNSYLEENPVSGMTAEQEEQLSTNTQDITNLKSALEQKGLPAGGTTGQVLAKKTDNDYDVEWKDETTGTGLSAEAIDKLEEVGNYLVYTTADGGSKWMELISILRNSSSGGDPGETVTLQSISATYTGGEVAVGTSLDSLTGITVTAHYSDGSTDTITDYALSGEIVEGKNTITVSYGGKTTTFTVTGVAESGGEEVAVTELGSSGTNWYSDGGDTLLKHLAKARSYTGVFEEETEVQVAVIVNETQYGLFYIGAYDGTDNTTGYYAKNFEISGYPSAGETYTTTYTVPSGYGVIVGGWSAKGNVTVKVVKIGV